MACERMRIALVLWLATGLFGCQIADRSDSFGAEGHFTVSGGLLGYVLPEISIGGKVGFYKQHPTGIKVDLEGLCKEDRLKVLEAFYASLREESDSGGPSALDQYL